MSWLRADIYSDALKRNVHINIALPDIATGRVPMLLLLHGMTDDDTCWQRRTSIERYADETGIAVVMPGVGLSWYCDTPGGELYFDFVSREVPAMARRLLPMLSDAREDTYVGGLSMGGYGAMKCALVCPGTFSAAVSLSGALEPRDLPRFVNPETVGGFDWEEAFGPLDRVGGTVNDLGAACSEETLRNLRVCMWCGTEDSLLGMTRGMRARIEGKCRELIYRETPGGHEWPLWDREIHQAMLWLAGRGEEAWR